MYRLGGLKLFQTRLHILFFYFIAIFISYPIHVIIQRNALVEFITRK